MAPLRPPIAYLSDCWSRGTTTTHPLQVTDNTSFTHLPTSSLNPGELPFGVIKYLSGDAKMT